VEKARNNKGQFVSGNPGRPKGAGNRISPLQKVRIDEVLSILSESLLDDLSTMKPKEKIELWKDLQEFIQPKLQRVAMDVGPAEDRITKIIFEVVGEGSEVAK
jgi:hypothetical protein